MKTLPADHDLSHLRLALGRVPENRRRTAVDGGAHTGTWTEVMADAFESVVAFEPAPDYAERIPDRENVTVYTVALGKDLAPADLVDGEENEGQTHVMPPEGEKGDTWIVPLDAYGLKYVDLLKLDVEGFEHPALLGAKRTIDLCRPWIIVEVNDLARVHYGQDPEDVHRRLRQWGYRPVEKYNKDHLYAP